MSDKFKTFAFDANGTPIEDVGDVSGQGIGGHLCAAHAKIAQVERIVKSYGGTRANEQAPLTNFDLAVGLSLLMSDTIEAFRDLIRDADIPNSAKETLFNEGDKTVNELGESLEAAVSVILGR